MLALYHRYENFRMVLRSLCGAVGGSTSGQQDNQNQNGPGIPHGFVTGKFVGVALRGHPSFCSTVSFESKLTVLGWPRSSAASEPGAVARPSGRARAPPTKPSLIVGLLPRTRRQMLMRNSKWFLGGPPKNPIRDFKFELTADDPLVRLAGRGVVKLAKRSQVWIGTKLYMCVLRRCAESCSTLVRCTMRHVDRNFSGRCHTYSRGGNCG